MYKKTLKEILGCKNIYILIGMLLLVYNNIVNIGIVLTIILIGLTMPLNHYKYIYIFLLPWEELFSLPFISSLLLVMQLIFVIKIALSIKKNNFKICVRQIDLMIIILVMLYALVSVIAYKNVQGLGICLDLIIIIYVFSDSVSNEETVWENIFKIIIISTFFSCLYGIIHLQFIPRWVPGLGEMPQFYGILGTTRSSIYINMSILFLFSLSIQKKKKMLLLIYMYIFLFMTLSMTGLAINILIIILCYISDVFYINKKKSIFSKYMLLFLIVILLVVGYLFRNEVSFLEAIFGRIDFIFENIKNNDLSGITTGRSDLLLTYVDTFNNLPILNQMFGTGNFSSYKYINYIAGIATNHSHNTIMDLIYVCGYLGSIVVSMYLLGRLCRKKRNKYFKTIIILKILILISGCTVSLLTSSYWYFWMLI